MPANKPSPTTSKPSPTNKPPSSTATYLRWLAILCAVMALFCLGVLLIGYKDPSIGRAATLVALCVASPILFWLSKRRS